MKGLIEAVNSGKTIIMGMETEYYQHSFEYDAALTIDGDDLVIGSDEDHCFRFVDFDNWSFIPDGIETEMIAISPDGDTEISICVI